jgi:hypothetical protein
MPQGLELFRGEIKDPCVENPLGPDVEEHLEFPDRVCDGVGPDREVDDDGAQDQFNIAEFSHKRPDA